MMTDPTQPSGPPPTASTSEFLLTFTVIVVAILLMLAFDTGLARIDKNANSATALTEYKRGQQFFAAGHTDDAIDHFRVAATLDRAHCGIL